MMVAKNKRILKDQLFKADCDLFWLAAGLDSMSDEEIEQKMKEFGQKYVQLFGLVVEEVRKGG